jgi:hypothetical protein
MHERLIFDCKKHHIMLDVRYRLKPEICAFPSKHFYEGKLANGLYVLNTNYTSATINILEGQPYSFLQVRGTEYQLATGSHENVEEAKAVVNLVKQLRSTSRNKSKASDYLCRQHRRHFERLCWEHSEGFGRGCTGEKACLHIEPVNTTPPNNLDALLSNKEKQLQLSAKITSSKTIAETDKKRSMLTFVALQQEIVTIKTQRLEAGQKQQMLVGLQHHSIRLIPVIMFIVLWIAYITTIYRFLYLRSLFHAALLVTRCGGL